MASDKEQVSEHDAKALEHFEKNFSLDGSSNLSLKDAHANFSAQDDYCGSECKWPATSRLR
jgi:hypothetical protein